MKQIFLLTLYVFACSSVEQSNFNRITSVLLKTTDDLKTNTSTKWETDVHFDCANIDLSKFDVSFYHKYDGNGPIVSGKIWATPKAPNTPPKFRNDYEYKPGFGFYKFHNKFVNWTTARRACQDEGAHLAIINSQAESDLLIKLFQEQTDPKLKEVNYVALGFHDLFTENEFVTIQGDPIESTGFAKWSPGQPDNYKESEDCGSVYVKNGLLNDINCSGNVPFICEKEAN